MKKCGPTIRLESLEVSSDTENIIDIGCGYGTFLIPAPQIISGIAIGNDIDQAYLDICQKK
jgi:ribosomal protein L11 methylase PrmA